MKRLYCYRQAVYRFSRNKAHNGMPSRGQPFGETGSLLHAPSEPGPRVLFVFLAGHTRINRYRHGQGHHTGTRRSDGKVGNRRRWALLPPALGDGSATSLKAGTPPTLPFSCCSGLQCSDVGLNMHLE